MANNKLNYGIISAFFLMLAFTAACENNEGPLRACTLEAMQCPNGSYVGRREPNCEFAPCPENTTPKQITTFEDCVNAGNPAMESYPRKCNANGKIFVEEIGENGLSKMILTRAGNLTLKYIDGQTDLIGSLFRGTPCISWMVNSITTKDLPISHVNINIYDKNGNRDMVCAQVVAEPQEINEVINNVDENTGYSVKFEETEVFSGRLGR